MTTISWVRNKDGTQGKTDERVYPFSNGSQFSDWFSSNCYQCKKFDAEKTYDECECSIDSALTVAQCEYGAVSQDIADRMGYTEFGANARCYNWPCLEFIDRDGEPHNIEEFRQRIAKREAAKSAT